MADKFEGSVIPVNTPGILNYQTWEPFGVVGLITAWNSPLGVLLIKLAPALAAGNAVVVKPSEHAPETGRLLQQVIAAGFDEDTLTVVWSEEIHILRHGFGFKCFGH